MTIRLKLALVLAGGLALATATYGLVFVRLQHRFVRGSEEAKVRLVIESVRRMAEESLMSRDPLMLLDYLLLLTKEHPEVFQCRTRSNAAWQTVGAPLPPGAKTVVRAVEVADEPRRIEVEVLFSAEALERREREAVSSALRGLGRAGGVLLFIGLILCIPLSHTLTRRIVLIERALEAISAGRLGEQVGAAGTDELSRLARGVNALSKRLREVDELKRTFAASVTHELRSPLGAIESQLKDMLGRPGSLSAEDRDSLERIRRNAARLEHFVNNLLQLARIEQGKLDFHPRLERLAPLVQDTVEFFQARARESGLELAAEIDESLPALRMDPDLLAQVVANLVSNAIKFTPRGGRITVRVRDADGREPGVQCSVEDTGVGIPPDALERIFKPFERAPNPLKATGTGLGLAISKTIVERHGGRIGARSSPGKGSVFYFVLRT